MADRWVETGETRSRIGLTDGVHTWFSGYLPEGIEDKEQRKHIRDGLLKQMQYDIWNDLQHK